MRLQQIHYDLEKLKDELGAQRLRSQNEIEVLKMKWRNPTLSIHGIEGAFSGTGGKTVIPAKISGKVSMRLVPDQDPDEIAKLCTEFLNECWKKLKTANKLKVKVIATGDWWLGNIDNKYFNAAASATFDVWKTKPIFTREGGSIPIVPFLEQTFNCPAIMIPIGQGNDGAHSQNEKIRIQNLINGKNLLKIFFGKFAKS